MQPDTQSFTCTACLIDKPEGDYGTIKRRGGVERMRECRPCKRERDRRAYADQSKRRDQVVASRLSSRIKASAALSQYRSGLSCSDCKASGANTKILFVTDGQKPVSDLARDGYSVERVLSEAATALPICNICLGRRNSSRSHAVRYQLIGAGGV
jgi:hypothetical protein